MGLQACYRDSFTFLDFTKEKEREDCSNEEEQKMSWSKGWRRGKE
jgi:hypothetical protein